MKDSIIRKVALLIYLFGIHTSIFCMEIQYTVRMEKPATHYFDISMQLSGLTGKQTILKMATWTPGSYLIREYARNVEGFYATAPDGKELPGMKINKNTWEVRHNTNTKIEIRYRLYANEMAVRNCYLDQEQAYINGAAVFLYVQGQENTKAQLEIDLPAGFSQIVTALKTTGQAPNRFQIENIDELFDSPILCGNPLVLNFQAAGVKHRAAFQGPGNMNQDRIKADFKKIIETEKNIFQHHPCTDYTFLVHNLPNGGGGLEHGHSTSLQTAWNTYDNEASYQNFLALVAHEYFHLWNVKRLRPKPLGPFNYDGENYCRMLWVAEGFTSYYDDFVLFRAGITKKERFLEVVASNLSRVESVPGMYVQSLAEAGLDAWIKYYRPNENSGNSQTDYYTKGAALATLLDMLLIRESKGQANLDNLLRDMYQEYYLKKDIWFTEEDLEKELIKRLGEKGKAFLQDYVYGLKRPDWKKEFGAFGIRIADRNEENKALSLGIRLQSSGQRMTVQSLPSNGPAHNSGLHIGDEIIAIGDRRIESPELGSVLNSIKAGQEVEILYSRNGRVLITKVMAAPEPGKSFRLDWDEKATPDQDFLRKKWLRLD
jgi:predicted metalloprotease with PDZ domain